MGGRTLGAHGLASFVFDAGGIHHDHGGAPYARYVSTWSPNLRVVEEELAWQTTPLAAVAIEDNATTAGNRQNYRCVSGVMPSSHWQSECNAQKLSSFATYQPEQAFPRIR